MSSAKDQPTKLPFVVFLLALGTFLMCTTEFIVAGLLPEMSSDLGVSVAHAGLLITAFAVGMIVGSPTLAVATLRLPRRSTLVLALAVFALGHVIAALSSSFAIVLAARVLTALVTGAFWAVASVVATTAAGPANSSRALGVMMSGVGLATVVGVPLGSWVGQIVGWRGAFWALAVLSALSALVIGRFVPADEHRQAPSVRSELGALRTGRIWLLLLATALITGGYMAAFSYISPLLTERTGLPAGAVPLVLVGFGIGSLLGTNLGGRFGDRKPLAAFTTTAVAAGLVLLLLVPLSTSTLPTVILVVLLGMTGMAVPPIATSLAVRFASSAPTLAAALAVSAFNAGIALGSWVAGSALDSSLGATGPALVGTILVAVGLIPLMALAATHATRTDAAAEPHAGHGQDTPHETETHHAALPS
ncbi:MFS transporter [Streptomyces variegatus]|uniref:MFS transporter n=1 Tax=Streptomyces variegatus TaxID=284040 RepID=UPI003C2E82C3